MAVICTHSQIYVEIYCQNLALNCESFRAEKNVFWDSRPMDYCQCSFDLQMLLMGDNLENYYRFLINVASVRPLTALTHYHLGGPPPV